MSLSKKKKSMLCPSDRRRSEFFFRIRRKRQNFFTFFFSFKKKERKEIEKKRACSFSPPLSPLFLLLHIRSYRNEEEAGQGKTSVSAVFRRREFCLPLNEHVRRHFPSLTLSSLSDTLLSLSLLGQGRQRRAVHHQEPGPEEVAAQALGVSVS